MACLSELPDDLIRRVFYFAPAKEAASSGATSRRFRSLWRSTDAVNLGDDSLYKRARVLSHRDVFVSAAKEALYAPDDRVARLSFRLEACRDITIKTFLYCGDEQWSNRIDVVADVLSHPKARLLEDLQIAIDYGNRVSLYHHEVYHTAGIYELAVESLPTDTLRVLDLTGCQIYTVPAGVAFPRLTSLRMDNCSVPPQHLQILVFAAPTLQVVRLESVSLRSYEAGEQGTVARLHLPVATWLVLDKCGWPDAVLELEIHAPRLRRFRYRGILRKFSLCPPQPPPDLSRVDLHFISGDHRQSTDHGAPCVLLWQFLHNFGSTKEFNLVVEHLEDIAVVHGTERAKLLRPLFPNLERLKLEGVHRLEGKTAAVAIANLLRCCPMVRDLQIDLTTTKASSRKRYQHVRDFLQRKSRDDLHNSINHFLRRRLLSPEGEGDDDDDEAVADIPALTGRSFRCLQHSLRRVSLRFRQEQRNCFGMRLIKFFAENARALEEMCIDGGNNWMNEHVNRKVERWIANSSHKRNTALTVLPLKR